MSYDQWKTDSGYAEKTPEEENEGRDCPICNGDCAGANPPVYNCPLKEHTMSTSGEKTQLLPCPFCGSKAVQKPHSETLRSMQRIECQGCFISTAYYSTSHGGDPALAWNARAVATPAEGERTT